MVIGHGRQLLFHYLDVSAPYVYSTCGDRKTASRAPRTGITICVLGTEPRTAVLLTTEPSLRSIQNILKTRLKLCYTCKANSALPELFCYSFSTELQLCCLTGLQVWRDNSDQNCLNTNRWDGVDNDIYGGTEGKRVWKEHLSLGLWNAHPPWN